MARRTVLVVDDDPLVGELLRTLLAGTVSAVTVTYTVDAARESAAAERPSLVILDHLLADEEGYGVAHAMRAIGVPVIVLTGFPHVASRYKALGAAHVVLKPFRIDELVDLVAELLVS